MQDPTTTELANRYPVTSAHRIGNGCIKFLLAIFFILVGGIAGCTATARVAGDLSVTYLAQWHPIATAPSGAVSILYVQSCNDTRQPPEALYYIGLSNGQVVTYDECRPESPQWRSTEAPNGGTGGLVPCVLGQKPEYAVAESRMQGVVQDCRDMEGSFEGWTDRARYVLYADGRLVAWPMSIGINGLMDNSLAGLFGGVVLAGYILFRRVRLWRSIQSIIFHRRTSN